MRQTHVLALLSTTFITTAMSQKIWDVWQTTSNQSSLFVYKNINPPIPFNPPSTVGQAQIMIDDSTSYQSLLGVGGSLTDSSALTLNNLKSRNPTNYWKLIKTLFDPTDGANAGGLSSVRVPLGASDFSPKPYSFDDTYGDTSLKSFDINRAPSYLFSVLKDIQSVNKLLKIHVVPWSPPAWMKDGGTMNGGALKSANIQLYASYLFKCVQGFQSKGIPVYAVSIQNEPMNTNPTYPTSRFSPSTEGQVGRALKTLLKNNGFSTVKLIGFDHNWDSAAGYPVQLMQNAGDSFDGVAFHCYGGNVAQQDLFAQQYPKKEIYFTGKFFLHIPLGALECSGVVGSDWWSDVKWYLDNIFIGSLEHGARAALMWNIALDANGNPKLPGTSSCGGSNGRGCRGIVSVNSDGTYTLNQEFYAMAQVSKAILPRDVGGPWAKRIGARVTGSYNWALRVASFVTGRANPKDWLRYSIVVMNWNDQGAGGPVQSTIEFQGKQALYTFPVGVTTLWWYAPAPTSLDGTITPEDQGEFERLYVYNEDGMQEQVVFQDN